MNPYTALAICNVAIVICVIAVAWITKSPWSLVGLFFLFAAKANPHSKTPQADRNKERWKEDEG